MYTDQEIADSLHITIKKQEYRDQIQSEREDKYQKIIKNLTDKSDILDELKENVQELKNVIVK